MIYEGLRQNITEDKDIEAVFITTGILIVGADFNGLYARLKLNG
jgi:hypothetical protein